MTDKLPARLLGNKVLVQPHAQGQTTTASGIIIPITIQNPLEQATVVMYANGVINVRKGDEVLYPSGGGIVQEYDGVKYKFLSGPTETNEGDIWAVL